VRKCCARWSEKSSTNDARAQSGVTQAASRRAGPEREARSNDLHHLLAPTRRGWRPSAGSVHGSSPSRKLRRAKWHGAGTALPTVASETAG
jgi:hypothetical protein